MAGEAFGLLDLGGFDVLDLAAPRPRMCCPDCGGPLEWGGSELFAEIDGDAVVAFADSGWSMYRCGRCRMVGAFSPLWSL